MGIYGLIEDVRYEPDPQQVSTALRARIEGWFAVAVDPGDGGGDEYNLPVRGEIYYACPGGMEAACRAEWAMLKSLIGSAACAAWGDRTYLGSDGNGTVRPLGTATMTDLYPLGGVSTTVGGQCPAIKASAVAVDLAEPTSDMGVSDLGPRDLGLQPIDLARTGSFSGCDVAPADDGQGAFWLIFLALIPLVLLFPSLRRRA